MVSSWERALQQGDGQAAAAKRRAALRAQAQARTNWSNTVRMADEAKRDAAAAAEANRRMPVQNLFEEPAPPPTPMEMFVGRQEQAQRQAQNAPIWNMMLYGEQKESALPGRQEAGKLESFLRTQAGEDEFRLAGRRAQEGRLGAAAGWGLLGLAGAVPFFGDIAQGAAKASRAARSVEAASDVARDMMPVRGSDILDDVSREITEQGSIRYTMPDIQRVPEQRRGTLELAHRQGYDNLPRVVSSQEFEATFSQSGKVVYRGISDSETASGVEYAREFIGGDYWVGHGVHGYGSYFAKEPKTALLYGANPGMGHRVASDGAIIRAVISPDAKILDSSDPSVIRAFEQSSFSDISEFAIASGYDAISVNRRRGTPQSQDYFVILNRTALVVDETPATVYGLDIQNMYDEYIDYDIDKLMEDLFRGGKNRENIRAKPDTTPEGFNF